MINPLTDQAANIVRAAGRHLKNHLQCGKITHLRRAQTVYETQGLRAGAFLIDHNDINLNLAQGGNGFFHVGGFIDSQFPCQFIGKLRQALKQ